MIQLKQKLNIFNSVYASDEISQKEIEEFTEELEDLMNEYKIYRVDATLSPYSKEIKLL